MAEKDFYKVLGVSRTADDAEIKKAYRRLAMKHHPDRNKGDKGAEESFKEIQEAYAVLSDPEKRSAYDRFGTAGINPGMQGGGGAGNGNFSDVFEEVFSNFGDIFGNARSGGGARREERRGRDLQIRLTISLERAVFGGAEEIVVPTQVSCQSCAGSGAKAGTKPVLCETCDGEGMVRIQQGFFSIQQTCPTCQGEGRRIAEPCMSCYGQGMLKKDKRISVKVPAGVDSGDRIRLSNEGEAGPNGAAAGDLYVQIMVEKHAVFTREENDLYCNIPVSLGTAALGGDIDIPTLDGRIKLKIPAETQSGKLFRLRGKGVKPVRGGAPGDLLCHVVVETPVNLTAQQKNILKELDLNINQQGEKHYPLAKSWFENVKRFFDRLG